MSLKGKNALVTGSSRGIGRGIALKLAREGARVAVHYYRNREAAETTLAKIRELGSHGFLVQADVCHPEEVRRIFQQVRTEFGSLDIFVSNARTEAPTFSKNRCRLKRSKHTTWSIRRKALAPSVGGGITQPRSGRSSRIRRWPCICPSDRSGSRHPAGRLSTSPSRRVW